MLEEEALLGKIALARGVLTRDQLKKCLRFRRKGGEPRPLIAAMVELGFVKDKDLEAILAEQRRVLKKRVDENRQKKKLRESQSGVGLAVLAAPGGPARARVMDESVDVVRCRSCGKAVAEGARRCMHCGKKIDDDGDQSRIDRRRAKSEYLCNICFYPVFEDETRCPSCHAVFLKPGEGGEFKCSQCMHFVSEKDTVCPWCRAEFMAGEA